MLSIKQFMDKFPDDDACRKLLYRLRWGNGFRCGRCGECGKPTFIPSRNLYECRHCRKQTSITSGTIMHRTKLPLRYWLFVYYWAASGHACSARRLSFLLKLNYRTALRLLHIVRNAMGQAVGNRAQAFWMPSKQQIVANFNRNLSHKADQYVRRTYKHVSKRSRQHYNEEFRFHLAYGYNPRLALKKLLRAGAACLWQYPLSYWPLLRFNKKQSPEGTSAAGTGVMPDIAGCAVV